MKLHLIQHGLSSLYGHYHQETRAWKAAAASAGLAWHAYANRKLDATLAKELDADACFHWWPHVQLDPDPLSRDITDLLVVSERFANDCSAIQREGVQPDDVVLVSYATHPDVFGVARWLQTLTAAQRPNVGFVFHLPDHNWTITADRATVQGKFDAWRFAANQLKAVLPVEKQFYFALDARLAGYLGPILQAGVTLLPIVHQFLDSALAIAPAQRRFDVAIPGTFRGEKGSEMGVEILKAVAARQPGLRFSLQYPDPASAQRVADQMKAEQVPAYVDFIVGELSQQEYAERLASSRLILLPYVQRRYAARASGVCSEAFGYGVPVVVPSGTWMADRLADRQGAGVSFDEWKVEAIADAVMQALARLPALTEQALTLAPLWRATHSADVALAKVMATVNAAKKQA